MKRVGLSGWGGFLASKLRERTEVEWVDGTQNIDMYLHLGSPTFTHSQLSQHDAHVMHQYVRETIKLVDRLDMPIIFASTTGVDDLVLDHSGSTSYNLGKFYLENYIKYNCDDYLILRIGTIYSTRLSDVNEMKLDRLQPRILRKDYTDIPFEDLYLDVDVFVAKTIDAILNFKSGILEYPLDKLTMGKLIPK
jgi:hypothetical protein